MLLAVHGNEAYLSVFVSADWPNKLEYRAGSKQPKSLQIDEKEVINATAIALNEFMEYLKKKETKKINIQVDRVWP